METRPSASMQAPWKPDGQPDAYFVVLGTQLLNLVLLGLDKVLQMHREGILLAGAQDALQNRADLLETLIVAGPAVGQDDQLLELELEVVGHVAKDSDTERNSKPKRAKDMGLEPTIFRSEV